MPDTSWIRSVADGVELRLRIQPRAKASEVVGPHGDELKIRVQAPPVDGKANLALVRFLADLLQVPRADVTLTGGSGSRSKRLRVRGIGIETALRRLQVSPPQPD